MEMRNFNWFRQNFLICKNYGKLGHEEDIRQFLKALSHDLVTGLLLPSETILGLTMRNSLTMSAPRKLVQPSSNSLPPNHSIPGPHPCMATFGMQSPHHISSFLILQILISKFNFLNVQFLNLIFKIPIPKFSFPNSNSKIIFKFPIYFKFNFQNSNS